MDTKLLVVLAIGTLLLVGIVFVSAQIGDKSIREVQSKPQINAQQICGPSACDSKCGGNCGIKNCGCS